MAESQNNGSSKAPRIYGAWTLAGRLGKGGNGDVFRATRGDEVGAIKLLTAGGAKRVARFRDEVTALEKCADILGVLPVLEAHLKPEGDEPAWFVMGLATPISDALGDRPPLRRVVEACAEIATTLSAMHARGFSHRDIKPENLFRSGHRWTVGDFGLVSFEGKTAVTATGERIGPTFFIAPEMLNSAITADGRRADVFSLAKTLWVLATGQRYPLPGAYDLTQEGFRIGTYLAEERTGPLDKLIASSTHFDPKARITMSQFVDELTAWLAPEPVAASEIQLDVKSYAVELERRRLAVEAARLRDATTALAAVAIYQRFRERLRPLANEVADSLERANFEPVRRVIDGYTWGFEVSAGVPAEKGDGGLLRLIVNVNLTSSSQAEVSSTIVLDRTSPTTFGGLLWDKRSSFLEGGSQEDSHLHQLRQDIILELPKAVALALELTLGGGGSVAPNSVYTIGVQSDDGLPLENAEVLFLDPQGVYLRATTDQQGIARIGPTHLGATTAFVAHPDFQGRFEPLNTSAPVATLVRDSGVSSMIAMNGWTAVKGLQGQIQIIADAQNRTYVYGQNVAIDGGQQHPVNVSLGRPTELRGQDGVEVQIVPKAVVGSCFLLDVHSASKTATSDSHPSSASPIPHLR